MTTGFVDSISNRMVDGWAADPAAPDTVIELTVFVDGHPHATVKANRLRRDLAADPARFGSGHHAFVYQFPVPLSPHKEHRVSVVVATTGLLLRNGEVLLPPMQELPALRPILITAPGRSGTTQMMNRLSQARGVCVAELYPFETRLIAYYASAYNVLTGRPVSLDQATHPDRLEGDGLSVRANPFGHADYASNFGDHANFNTFFSGAVPQAMTETMRGLVLSYYALLAEDQGKREARLFAEKNNNFDESVRNFTRRVFGPMREIVMVRDPRDLLLSQLAYFRRDDIDNSMIETTEACRVLLALRKQERSDMLFVRYEDMVFRPASTFEAVSAFLDTDVPGDGEQERESSIFREHATSASPAASVGRWRHELAPEQAERCNAAWGDFLHIFGYDTEDEFDRPG